MEESGSWDAVPCDDDDEAYVICDYTPGKYVQELQVWNGNCYRCACGTCATGV